MTLEAATPAAPVVAPEPRSATIGTTAINAITVATIPTMIASMMYASKRGPKPANVTPGAGPAASAGASHETIGVVGACSGGSPVGFVIGSLSVPRSRPSADLRRLGDRIARQVRSEHLRDANRSIRLLVRLEAGGDDPGESEPRAVQRVDELRLCAGFRAEADRHPAGLVVAEVRARAHLEPALDAGRPHLEVVLLRLDEAHLAGAHQDDAISQTEALEEELGPFRQPLECGRRLVGLLEEHHLDLVELMHAEDAAGVLAGSPGLAPEAWGVGGVADRKLVGVEDLVAVQVRDRHFGSRDEVQIVARHDVHLVFLVGYLAGPGGRRRVDDGGRPDFGHAVLAGVDVEEPVDQRALERGSGSLVDRKARAADLRPASVVDDVERFGELPMRLSGPRRRIRCRVSADLFAGLLDGQQLAPRPNGDVRLFAADGHVRVGRIRDAQQEIVDLRLDGRELGVDRGDPLARRGRDSLQVRDLGPIR